MARLLLVRHARGPLWTAYLQVKTAWRGAEWTRFGQLELDRCLPMSRSCVCQSSFAFGSDGAYNYLGMLNGCFKSLCRGWTLLRIEAHRWPTEEGIRRAARNANLFVD